MNSFDAVNKFETLVSSFFGAKYGVATDCCTHAIELSLRYDNIFQITCPKNTYPSIPMTLSKLNIQWTWNDNKWVSYYFLGSSRIVDGAVIWKQNSYIPNTLMCLSFQFKKHLSVGKGGMILTNNYNEYLTLKKMSYDGRDLSKPWISQDITTMGYHYYMTPETAGRGINKFYEVRNIIPKERSCFDYPDLSKMTVFNNGS